MQKRVLVAFVFCLASLILSLLVLTAGTRVNFLENVALITVLKSPSGDRLIYDLVGDGNYDWYSIHYLSICFGYNTTDAYGNIDGMTTTSCETSMAPATQIFDIGRAFVPWSIGVGFAGMAFLAFPFFFRGTFHHNGWLMNSLFLSWVSLMLGAVLAVAASSSDYNDSTARLFFWLTWAAAGCMFIAWTVEFVEYALQRFTPRGQPISLKYKPANVPWVSYGRSGLARAVNQDIGMMRADLSNMTTTMI